jgi:hypothetical protein
MEAQHPGVMVVCHEAAINSPVVRKQAKEKVKKKFKAIPVTGHGGL